MSEQKAEKPKKKEKASKSIDGQNKKQENENVQSLPKQHHGEKQVDEQQKNTSVQLNEKKEEPATAQSQDQSQSQSQQTQALQQQRKPQQIRWAIIHVYSSKNDTILTATDMSGAETIATCSGGKVVKSDREEGKPYAAMQATVELVNKLKQKEITHVNIYIRAPGGHGSRIPGPGAQAVVRTVARSGLVIGKIMDVTPVPSDTTRRPGGRRGRRV